MRFDPDRREAGSRAEEPAPREAPFHYRFADLRLESDLPLPSLGEAIVEATHRGAPLRIEEGKGTLATPARWLHEWRGPGGMPTLLLGRVGSNLLLRAPGEADFVVSPEGDHVRVIAGADGPMGPTLEHLLLDQILPRVLAHRGDFVLHASAVLIEGEAMILAGDRGLGKSTLAAALALGDGQILADDAVILRRHGDRVLATPTYPGARLLPDSIEALLGEGPPGVAVAHYTEKLRVEVPMAWAPAPVPVRRILVLEAPGSRAGSAGQPNLHTLAPAAACMALLHQSFRLDLTDRRASTDHFRAAAELSEGTEVCGLHVPRDYARLPELLDRLRAASSPPLS